MQGKSAPVYSPLWIKPRRFTMAAGATNDVGPGGAFDPSRFILFADYQNNPRDDLPELPAIRPTGATTTEMGSTASRHHDTANATFLDGHVDTLRPIHVKLQNGGLDLQPGQDWATGYAGTKPLATYYQLFTPFGPGYEGGTVRLIGSYPTIGGD